MKKLAGAIFALLMLGLTLPKVANVADVDWLGRISGLGGAERESWRVKESSGALGGTGHGIGQFEGLGVIPITPFAGLQLSGGVGGGDNVKLFFQGGPIFGWGTGKAGVFWGTQVRHYASSGTECCQGRADRTIWDNWIRPAASFYFTDMNLDIWYSQPVGGSNRLLASGGDQAAKRMVKVSEGRLALNWFPSFFMKDNTELTLGVHVTALSGADSRTNGVPMGVGPVAGMAVMPWQNLEVQLFKAQIDNRNRYRVTSGLQYYFNRANATLLQLRRMYLEPTNLPGTISSDHRPG
jgi:hypothetical protein